VINGKTKKSHLNGSTNSPNVIKQSFVIYKIPQYYIPAVDGLVCARIFNFWLSYSNPPLQKFVPEATYLKKWINISFTKRLGFFLFKAVSRIF
jgi:hypothetical protein